ncbi:MAG: 16S rRNA (cytosine(967)-C(5))-methyltransferase RsmB [Pseudomonadota bacterium]
MQFVQIAASIVVQQVLDSGRNLNQVLDESLRNKNDWAPAQRAALQDLSYGTLRFYGQLQAVLNMLLHKPLHDERVRCLLLVALYQLQYGKSASHAVVDHAVRAAHTLNSHVSGLVNALLRNFLRNQSILLGQAAQHPEGKYSYPQWWIDELHTQYGEFGPALLEAGNRHPPMTLRVNQRRSSIPDYLALLAQHDMSARIIDPQALQLDKPVPVDRLPGFSTGLVSVQDAGAQYAARLLDVHDGMHVLDACAAPGGKTAHILELAAVDLLALDKDEKRLQRVRENLQRLGLAAQLVAGDAADPDSWWDGKTFQRILADVPCSASGVVRRHPDIKWLRRRADIAGFAAQQLGILCSLWRLMEQDGKLLYATCSVFQQENEQVIKAFLAQQPDALRLPVILPDKSEGQLLPNDQHDGFFYALLHKQMTEDR